MINFVCMNPAQHSISDYLSLFRNELSGRYPEREITHLFHLLMEKLNYKKTEIYLNLHKKLSLKERKWLESGLIRLSSHCPVQYILGEVWFAGMRLKIRPGVFIPRPETEELVEWILGLYRDGSLRVLDIGTGSGCIALALKKNRPGFFISGFDNDRKALTLARENQKLTGLSIHWQKKDIHKEALKPPSSEFDLIVSNPPYIPLKEKKKMALHVAMSEPPGALFVPDSDPLYFYRSVTNYALMALIPGGGLFFEIHELAGQALCRMLEKAGTWHDITLRKDIHGKDRMLMAVKSLTSFSDGE